MDKNVRWPRVEGPMYIIPYIKPPKGDAPQPVCTENIMTASLNVWKGYVPESGT